MVIGNTGALETTSTMIAHTTGHGSQWFGKGNQLRDWLDMQETGRVDGWR